MWVRGLLWIVIGPTQGPELAGLDVDMEAHVTSNEVVGPTHRPQFIGPNVGKFSKKEIGW